MPILFVPLLGFIVFIIAAGWGFNALSHRVGADIAIAIYFLVLALLSAVPIAWLRRRKQRAVTSNGRTLVSRTFSGVGSSVVIEARERRVTLTVEGRTQRYAVSELKEWKVFEREIDGHGAQAVAFAMAGVAFRTSDVVNPSWSVPLANIEQARECVSLLDQLEA
jgi:5-enolpyruvylshikimate-3-phosphate synthase